MLGTGEVWLIYAIWFVFSLSLAVFVLKKNS